MHARLSNIATSDPGQRTKGTVLQRCACGKSAAGGECEACRKKRTSLQRSAYGEPRRETAPPEVHDVLRRPGRPLPESLRREAERALGYDFSRVRVHADEQAAASAASVSARAYAVSNHVVFGRNAYRPGSQEGDRLLMHELAHVRQQRSDTIPSHLRIAPSNDALEHEAQRVAAHRSGAEGGRSAAPGVIQRDELTDEEARRAAEEAAARCDIAAICRLRRSNPSAVPEILPYETATRCIPGAGPYPRNPCLFPLQPPSPGPTRPPTGPQPSPPGPTPAPSTGGPLAGLSDMLSFTLRVGDLTLNVDLPSEAKARLPLRFRSGARLTFELSGTTSGAFRFSARLDGIPHVSITLRAGVDLEAGTGSAGIVFGSQRQTCQVRNPTETRSAIEKAGKEIQTAVRALESRTEDGGDTARDHLMSIASGISDINEAIERARGPCRPLPSVEFEFGSRFPIRPPEGEGPPGASQAPFVGGTFRFRF